MAARQTRATWVLLSVLLAAGCQGPSPSRRVAKSEPPLIEAPGGSTVIEAAPARVVTFSDRHPLFAKPREYYDTSTSKNRVVKAATATVIGIPAGFVGEIRQIVRGQPPGSQTY